MSSKNKVWWFRHLSDKFAGNMQEGGQISYCLLITKWQRKQLLLKQLDRKALIFRYFLPFLRKIKNKFGYSFNMC